MAAGRRGACECGGQGNHRLLIDEDARLQIKEYPPAQGKLGSAGEFLEDSSSSTHTHNSSLRGPGRGCGRYIWAPGSPLNAPK